jgi:hypothetical protein
MIEIPLVVHPLPNNIDCLLGLDWFKNAKAVIDTVDKVLQFKSREVCLEDTNSSKQEFQQECYVADISDNGTEEDHNNDEQCWDEQIQIEEVNLPDLVDDDAENFKKYLTTKKHMFAYSYHDLGRLNGHEHTIMVNTEKPIYQHPYRKSIKESEDIKCEVAKMLDAGIIIPFVKSLQAFLISMNR